MDHAPTPEYCKLLDSLRLQFPRPAADPEGDAQFGDAVQQALAGIAALKSGSPILGAPSEPIPIDATRFQLADAPQSIAATIAQLAERLAGLHQSGHASSQLNVTPPPSTASIIGVLLAAIANPNLCSDESGRGLLAAENQAAAMTARLVGYDPESAGGCFTFGGAGTTLYGIKVGLEKAQPGSMLAGVRPGAVVLASRACHYSALNAAAWLGIGEQNVLLAPCNDDGSVRIEALAAVAKGAITEGRRIAAIVATLGSTDAFAIDDLAAIHALRERLVQEHSLDYRPHLHADAVAGWAWAAFHDYDFERNELGFSARTRRALAAARERIRHLPLADSLGVDFHKTGFAPYVSSLVLFRDRRDLDLIRRSPATTPYLYQSPGDHPGLFTLETSRSAAGPMAALASLLALGETGLRSLIGHAVEMAGALRSALAEHPEFAVVNDRNVGSVTLFRVYPPGADAKTLFRRELTESAYERQALAVNELNRQVSERLRTEALAGRGVLLSMTECGRTTAGSAPLAALKSYVLSPFCNQEGMLAIIPAVLAARDAAMAD
ncbi:MAG TPA: pyridoxal-dependent decarboxylase [Pirellulales bacterium]|nr:pyridoxal-dependent decarboxylase [Pirellulales bacterium]